jgi:hypothetical protein
MYLSSGELDRVLEFPLAQTAKFADHVGCFKLPRRATLKNTSSPISKKM